LKLLLYFSIGRGKYNRSIRPDRCPKLEWKRLQGEAANDPEITRIAKEEYEKTTILKRKSRIVQKKS
jgi:hypothetical protein